MPSLSLFSGRRAAYAAAVIAALFLTLFLVAACGDGATDPPPTEPDPIADPEPGADPEPNASVDPAAPVVSVELNEWSLVPDVTSIQSGNVTFSASNVGAEEHELVVLKTDVPADQLTVVDALVDESAYEEVGEIEVAPGLQRAATFWLTPGSYVLICNIEEHYGNGMYAEFEVEEVSGNLVIYSGRQEELIGPLIDRFEQETGVDVQVRYGSNAELIGTIFEEGSNSPADLFFGSDPGALGALAGRFSALPENLLNFVAAPFRSPDGTWIGVSGRARVVVYNTDNLTEADLPPSIYDFTDPQWSGRVGWAPTNGSFQAMVTAMRLTIGDDATRAWLEGMKANNPKEYPNNIATVQATADGEVDVGFVNHYYLYRFLAEAGESFPARNAFVGSGDAGSVVLIAGVGVLDSSDNVPAAQRFVEFLLSAEAQRYFSDETYEYPLVEGVEPEPGLLPLADIQVPDLDLSQLSDLEGTLALLRDAGVIP